MLVVLSSDSFNPASLVLCQPRFEVQQSYFELPPQPCRFLLDLLVDDIELSVECHFILIACIDESTNAFIENLVLFYFIIKLFLELMQMLLLIMAAFLLVMRLSFLSQLHLKSSLIKCMLDDVQLLGHLILFGGQLKDLGFASIALSVLCTLASSTVSMRLMLMRSSKGGGLRNTAGDWKRGLNSCTCI